MKFFLTFIVLKISINVLSQNCTQNITSNVNFTDSLSSLLSQYRQVLSVEEGLEPTNLDSTYSILFDGTFDTLGEYFIPSEIGSLYNLRSITIESNIPFYFPAQIQNCEKILCIWIRSEVNTNSLPMEIENCTNIQSFSLMGKNKIQKLPSSIFNLNKLKYFSINLQNVTSKEMLKSIYKLRSLRDLKYIYLQDFGYGEGEKVKIVNYFNKRNICIEFSSIE